MRLGGAAGSRLALRERSQALLSDAATVLLFSVALATTFYEGEHFAGMARVLGVAFAVFLARRKMPLIVCDRGGGGRYRRVWRAWHKKRQHTRPSNKAAFTPRGVT